jgi:hypothetical protein
LDVNSRPDTGCAFSCRFSTDLSGQKFTFSYLLQYFKKLTQKLKLSKAEKDLPCFLLFCCCCCCCFCCFYGGICIDVFSCGVGAVVVDVETVIADVKTAVSDPPGPFD